MKPEKAIEVIESIEIVAPSKRVLEIKEAVNTAVKSLRRDTAAEVTLTRFGDGDVCIYCPSCNHCYCAEDWGDFNYCPNCGQALEIKEDHHANNRKN